MKTLMTGVSRGLGLAIAQCGLSHGDQIFGWSRSAPPESVLGQMTFEQVDLSNPAEITEACAKIGNVDRMILNAGQLNGLKMLHETSLEEIRREMQVNVWANKQIVDHFLKVSAQAGPDGLKEVIAISSGAALYANPGWGSYTLSKSALNKLMAVYAEENPQIYFLPLGPGLVMTKMMQGLLNHPEPERFSSLEFLKQNEKADPQAVAEQIYDLIADPQGRPPSGQFFDLRDGSS